MQSWYTEKCTLRGTWAPSLTSSRTRGRSGPGFRPAPSPLEGLWLRDLGLEESMKWTLRLVGNRTV